MTLFSVITVTKNNLPGLRKTYASILKQSWMDYEWIVQDGLSNDGTAEFIKEKGADYECTKDGGIYDAMNKAMARARGDYLIFMNAGDAFADNNVLEQIQDRLGENTYDFLYGDALEGEHYKTARRADKIGQGMITHHQAMIYARESIDGLKYNTDYLVAADYEFTLRALQKSDATAHLNFPVCAYEPGGVAQQNALQGRIEQFKIRRALDYNVFENAFVFTGQSGLHALRTIFPKLYWMLKAPR